VAAPPNTIGLHPTIADTNPADVRLDETLGEKMWRIINQTFLIVDNFENFFGTFYV
jgi:hypothetical protein